jgi:hypothetical protein
VRVRELAAAMGGGIDAPGLIIVFRFEGIAIGLRFQAALVQDLARGAGILLHRVAIAFPMLVALVQLQDIDAQAVLVA